MHRLFCVTFVLVVATSFSVMLTGARAAPEVIVRQVGRLFTPAKLSIARDTLVRFVNDETIVHHAFVDTPTFAVDSGDIAPGGSAVLRFDKEGRFLVRCAIHPKMRLDVDVAP